MSGKRKGRWTKEEENKLLENITLNVSELVNLFPNRPEKLISDKMEQMLNKHKKDKVPIRKDLLVIEFKRIVNEHTALSYMRGMFVDNLNDSSLIEELKKQYSLFKQRIDLIENFLRDNNHLD